MRTPVLLSLCAVVACTSPTPAEVGDSGLDTDTTPSTTDTDTTDQTTKPPDGLCGDVSTWDLSIRGRVIDWWDQPYEGAQVYLEDRGWVPGTVMANATVDAQGLFLLEVTDLTSVEDCWGTLLDYVVVATADDLTVEEGINSQLYGAILDGSLTVDLTSFALELE